MYKVAVVLLIVLNATFSFAQHSKIDSLFQLSTVIEEDTARIELWLAVAELHTNIDSVHLYAEKSIALSREIDYYEGEGKGYDLLGSKHSNKGDQELALSYYLKTLKQRKKYSDYLVVRTLTGIGIVYYRLNDVEKSVEYYKAAIKIAKADKNYRSLGALYNNLAIVSAERDEFQIALAYYDKTLLTLDHVPLRRSRYMKAIVLLNKSDIHIRQGKYAKALSELRASEKLILIIEEEHVLSYVYQTFGNLYMALDNYHLSKEYFDLSMELGEEQENSLILSENYKELSELEKRASNFEMALLYYKKYINYKDTIAGAEVKKQMNELSVKYESEKQKQELIVKDAQLAKDAVNMKLSLIGIGVVLLFSIVLIIGYFRKKKINQELEKLSIVASETDNVVIISDADGNLEWMNPGFTRVYGYTFEEYISEVGKSLHEISGASDIGEYLDEVKRSKKSVHYSGVNTNKNGVEFWTQTTLTPILNKQGEVRKIVAIDSDISVLKEAEQEIQKQKTELENKQELISDSIDYAKRIQQAVFPTLNEITGVFPNSFVYLQPKDVVSGDFYWTYETDDSKYFAVVDCTGHGVPGAFMTIIGINILNELIGEKTIHTDEIIAGVNTKLRARLSAGVDRLKDGMDMALIRIEKTTNRLEFSGSHLSCYISNSNGVEELKGSRGFIGMSEDIATNRLGYDLKSGDEVFLFTDGYPDQKGGVRNKKFYYQPLVAMLREMHSVPVDEQRQHLLTEFSKWKGDNEQIDDILIAGIKF